MKYLPWTPPIKLRPTELYVKYWNANILKILNKTKNRLNILWFKLILNSFLSTRPTNKMTNKYNITHGNGNGNCNHPKYPTKEIK